MGKKSTEVSIAYRCSDCKQWFQVPRYNNVDPECCPFCMTEQEWIDPEKKFTDKESEGE